MRYTQQQCDAIRDFDNDNQIIACAGSGKTAVAEGRVVKCLMCPGVVPRNIVALTYCEDAAASLKRRITTLVREKLGEVVGLSEMYIGTIHSYCLHLLQQELYLYRKYAVLSEVQQRLLVAANPLQSGLTSATFIGGKRAGEALGPGDTGLYVDVLEMIREEMIDVRLLPPGLRRAVAQYDALLDEHHYLEYARILVEAHRALTDDADAEHRQLQERLAARLKYVIVDEYQDANPIIEAIIARLHQLGAHVCVIGDDDQQIYSWRGADIGNFLSFSGRYHGARVRRLEYNFRSSSGVVDAARAVAERNGPNRMAKTMRSASHITFELGDLLALTFPHPDTEAAWIAAKIAEMRGMPFTDAPGAGPRGLSWSDCAILLRSVRNDAAPIVAALDAAGIPYVLKGMAGLLDPPEAEAAAVSFESLAGLATADDVASAWRRAGLGITKAELEAALSLLERTREWDDAAQGVCCLQRVFLSLLGALGLHEGRAGEGGVPLSMAHLGRVAYAVADFQAIRYRLQAQAKFSEFATWLRGDAATAYEDVTDATSQARPDAVVVTTVHCSKGLEWPCVFLPALQDGRFPSAARRYESPRWRVVPRRLVLGSARYDGSLADERRLFYVAATRAQKYLYCSWAPSPTKPQLDSPSPFFSDFAARPDVLTDDCPCSAGDRIEPAPRHQDEGQTISFTSLNTLRVCPHRYRLRYGYRFPPPVAGAMGFGKTIHDCTAEVHQRVLRGGTVTEELAEELVARHLHLPYADTTTRQRMSAAAVRIIRAYLRRHIAEIGHLVYSEQDVEISVGDVLVTGRIDLAVRADGGVVVVEQKTADEAMVAEAGRTQLGIYSLGHQALTGETPAWMEMQHMDDGAASRRERVTDGTLAEAMRVIAEAGRTLRAGAYAPLPVWSAPCQRCDVGDICVVQQRHAARQRHDRRHENSINAEEALAS